MSLYKMKQICEQTRLTEKAVRLYVQKGLVHPQTEDGLHNTAIFFTEENLEELKQIAVLRNANFSIPEILAMKENPELVYELVREKEELLETDTAKKLAHLRELERMKPADAADLKKLTEHLDLRPERSAPRNHHRFSRILTILALLVIVLILICGTMGHLYFIERFFVELAVTAIIGCILGITGIFCLTIPGQAKKHPHQAEAAVLDVTQDTRFDSSFAMGRSVVPGAGFREQGLGGSWTFFMMLFHEIRPDNWFPLLQFRDENGVLRHGTIRHGLFRRSLSPGDRVKITYDDADDGLVYPLKAPGLRQKCGLYLGLGILLIGISAFFMPKVVEIMNGEDSAVSVSGYYRTPLDVLQAGSDVLDGTIEQTENSLTIHYSRIRTVQHVTFCLHRGDVVVMKNTDSLGNLRDNVNYGYLKYAAENSDYSYYEPAVYYLEGIPERMICFKDGCYDFTLAMNDRNGSFCLYVKDRIEDLPDWDTFLEQKEEYSNY